MGIVGSVYDQALATFPDFGKYWIDAEVKRLIQKKQQKKELLLLHIALSHHATSLSIGDSQPGSSAALYGTDIDVATELPLQSRQDACDFIEQEFKESFDSTACPLAICKDFFGERVECNRDGFVTKINVEYF